MLRFSRTAAALVIAEMLLFALAMAPDHVSAHSSHETCHICAFINHPPILRTGAIAPIRPTIENEFLPPLESLIEIPEPRLDNALSRAPPSYV